MPTILESDDDIATFSVNELFLDVLCADEDLVRAEFEEIIAAEWSSPPPDKPDRADPEQHPRRARRHREASDAAPRSQPHHPAIGGWSRKRSPPPAPPTAEDRKGR